MAGAMPKRLVLLALAIALFGAAVMVAIYLATEPGAPAAPGPRGAAEASFAPFDPVSVVSFVAPPIPAQLPVLAGPAETPSSEWRRENPTVPAPVPNKPAPVAAPPPRGLPVKPEAREDAILDHRRRQFAEQMERLNRRNAQRGGVPQDAGAKPSQEKPRPGDRRGTLSSPP
jgi:hypothetical protein